MIEKFEWVTTGYCTALERIARRDGRFRHIRFPATLGILQHSTLGTILFDTGYAPRFFDATRYFPYKIYRYATPVFSRKEISAKAQLERRGIDPLSVKHILLSHFHGDHVCGLKDFPNAQFYCHAAALEQWASLRGFGAVRNGLLPDLFPDDFQARCTVLNTRNALDDPFFGMYWDVFGDGSVRMPWLPGHGRGQLGAQFQCKGQSWFLVADAAWFADAVYQNILPSPVVRLFFDDWKAYKTTLVQLQRYHQAHPGTIILPSHCQKQFNAVNDLDNTAM